MTDKTSIPAFPNSIINQNTGDHTYEEGMSLRDWFAGQALVGMGNRRWEGEDKETATQKHARACYSIADAMLEARKTPQRK